MSITYESTHARYVQARQEYFRLESELAAARAKLTAAERDCSVEWRKVLEAAERRGYKLTSQDRGSL